MNEPGPENLAIILTSIRRQAKAENVRFTLHAHQEMIAEDIKLDEIFWAIANSQIVEHYPDHKRGACALIWGLAQNERPLHIVCTTNYSALIIITVYEPKLPKWITPTQRSR